MSLKEVGARTSDVEVTGITARGVWLFAAGKEYFLPFDEYPWFREAQVNHVLAVEMSHGSHLYWPELDVDIEIDCLEQPEKYPLIARTGNRA